MIAELPLVWLALATPAGGDPGEARGTPTTEQDRAMTSWARARGVRLASPRGGGAPNVAIDFGAADRVEQELERARDAIAALDGDAADRAIEAARKDLLAHPELPNAAWLLAEVERAAATRASRIAPIDADAAEEAWARAAALDGGRASGIGEPRTSRTARRVHATIAGGGPDVALTLDGAPVAAGPIERSAGVHQLVATRGGRVAWAAWVPIAEGAVIAVPDVAGAACSADDLSRARLVGDAIEARGVRCPRWVAATPSGDGEAIGASVRVATCEADRCGALLEWHAPRDAGFVPAPRTDGPYKWPAWGTWTLVGAGAVATGVIVIVATGVFAPTRTDVRFVNGGIKPSGALFSF